MRTEEQVFEDFKKLGYTLVKGYKNEYLRLQGEWDDISISFTDKSYCKTFGGYDGVSITIKEHELLHELFKIWGWL